MSNTFRPISFLKNGTAQTIASVFWPQINKVSGVEARHLVSIEPHGALSIVENRPFGWMPGNRIVLLVHGLTGSENSTHLIRLANAFVRRGILAIRMNMRGCGSGEGLASGIYHSGRSEDTKAVLEWIGRTFVGSRVTQIGISLGGNATLKMAGEYGEDHPDFLEGVVSVSAPIDLAACSNRISHWKNFLLDRYFALRLTRHVESLHKRFPDKIPPLPTAAKIKKISLAEFDDLYTGPTSGFRDGAHYYQECSAAPLISKIQCQTLLLIAEDDPIITTDAYRALNLGSHQKLVMTRHGGHAAWLGRGVDEEFGSFWMDQFVVQWVNWLT